MARTAPSASADAEPVDLPEARPAVLILETARSAFQFHRTVEDLLAIAAVRTPTRGLTATHCWTLLALSSWPAGTATMTLLDRTLGLSTRQSIKALKERGYLDTAPSHSDGRSTVLHLTPAGRRSVQDILVQFERLIGGRHRSQVVTDELAGLVDRICAAGRELTGTPPP